MKTSLPAIACIILSLLSLIQIPLANTQSGNAEITRNRNLQLTALTSGNADATRYRNLQSLELAPPATFNLTVEVTNSTDLAVEGATVKAANITILTNSSGYAVMSLPYGTHNVSASHPDYFSTSWIVDLDTDKNITLTLARPYVFQGEIPDSHIIINPIAGGYNISLLNLFASSSSDVFFDWTHKGTLQNATAFQNFTYGQLPNLLVEAAKKGSLDYPKAWYKYLMPIALTPTTGQEGAFLAEPTPYAAASIFIIPDPPIMGKPAILGVILHNPFSQSLHISRIDFQVSGLTIGGYFKSVGYLPNVVLDPGQASLYNVTWTPDVSGHHCVRVVLTYSPTTQTVQKNLDIEPDIAPRDSNQGQYFGKVDFNVGNPAEKTKDITIRIKRQCPDSWITQVKINGNPIQDGDILSNTSPRAVYPAYLRVEYPRGSGGSIGIIDVEAYIDGTLVAGIRKIVIPTEVIPLVTKNTTFNPQTYGFSFPNWAETVPVAGWQFGGYCFSMSVLSWWFWRLGIPTPKGDPLLAVSGLVRAVQYNEMVTATAYKTFAWVSAHVFDSNFVQLEYASTYTQIADGTPVPLVLTKRGNLGDGHAVVAYKIEDMGQGIKYIYVYDPDHPEDSNKKIIVRTEDTSATMQPYEGYDVFAPMIIGSDFNIDLSSTLLLQSYSNYELHLYDANGKHTGFNSLSNATEQQILNSTYTGIDTEPQVIGVFVPYTGIFRAVLIGRTDSTYHLVVQPVNLSPATGWDASIFWFNGTILQGQTIEFTMLAYRDAEGKLELKTQDLHEIGITKIESSKTVVAQGYKIILNGTLQNYGNFIEGFNITAYANTTEIQTIPVALTGGNSTTISFTWNTAGFAKGNYIISVVATTVPGEIDTADNTFTYGVVKVTIPGDINGDFFVNINDLALIGLYWQQHVPSAPANVDINGDGIINITDLAILGLNWQKHT